MSIKESIAYKVGFYDGYIEGNNKNPYHHLKERDYHRYYIYGYDKGVSIKFLRKELKELRKHNDDHILQSEIEDEIRSLTNKTTIIVEKVK